MTLAPPRTAGRTRASQASLRARAAEIGACMVPPGPGGSLNSFEVPRSGGVDPGRGASGGGLELVRCARLGLVEQVRLERGALLDTNLLGEGVFGSGDHDRLVGGEPTGGKPAAGAVMVGVGQRPRQGHVPTRHTRGDTLTGQPRRRPGRPCRAGGTLALGLTQRRQPDRGDPGLHATRPPRHRQRITHARQVIGDRGRELVQRRIDAGPRETQLVALKGRRGVLSGDRHSMILVEQVFESHWYATTFRPQSP